MQSILITFPLVDFLTQLKTTITDEVTQLKVGYWDTKRTREIVDFFESQNYKVQVEKRNNATLLYIS